mmetsp:Transcript_12200/g.32843  ORF Transcript_12200/g.32843 Transcript_12200/m.32843 type:complete len:315 (-) Transcript_12200:557-1501(-)
MALPTKEALTNGGEIQRPSLVEEEFVYNFGYGSNIYPPAKLHLRGAPGSGGVNFDEFQVAKLRGWRLAFDLAAFPPAEPSMASIEPLQPGDLLCVGGSAQRHFGVHDSEGCMYGALIKLRRAEYNKLWRSEGGSMKETAYLEVEVECETQTGEVIRAVAFRTSEKRRYRRDVAPSLRYRTLIIEGARSLGVPEEYQHALERIPKVVPIPQFLRPFFIKPMILFFRCRRSELKPVRDFSLRAQQVLFELEMSFMPLAILAETRASAAESRGQKATASVIRALCNTWIVIRSVPFNVPLVLASQAVRYMDGTRIMG